MGKIKISARYKTGRQVRTLLMDTAWTQDLQLRSRVKHGQIYTHPDGRVLHTLHSSGGVLYISRNDFDAKLAEIELQNQEKSHHILDGRFPYERDFPAHVSFLVNDLQSILKIDASTLNFSLVSLNDLEAKVQRLGAEKYARSPVFPALIAYVGEVMRRSVNGKWIMKEEYGVWEPWIIDEHGRECTPIIFLYDKYVEGEGFSLAGAAQITLANRRKLNQSD